MVTKMMQIIIIAIISDDLILCDITPASKKTRHVPPSHAHFSITFLLYRNVKKMKVNG